MNKLIQSVTNRFIFFTAVAALGLLVSAASCFGQSSTDDVVYLKNGSIIRGTIIEQVPNKSIKIQTQDGNVFVYEISQVEKITKEAKRKVSRTEEEEGKPIRSGILFNPLGFLQFGPIVTGEFKVAPNTVIGPQIRFSGLGILYHVVASDENTNSVDVSSMAIGINFKQFFENPDSPNRFYVGAAFEYGWGGTEGASDYGRSWEGEHSNWDFMSNFGYRWRFPSNFFLNAGLFAGVAQTTKDDWWYIDSPRIIHSNDTKTYIFGMLELSLGWEF